MSEKEPRRVIIDCDPGIDDALAIILVMEAAIAKPAELEVLAITTTQGNASLADATLNACRLVDHFAPRLSQPVPVFAGAEHPLTRTHAPPEWPGHGPQGMGACSEAPRTSPESEHAALALARLLRAHPPRTVDILLLGPMSNLALAIKLDSSIAARIGRLVFMGGCHMGRGNVTPIAEFNHFNDPEAASVTLTAVPRSVMISWELTLYQSAQTWDWYATHIGTEEGFQQKSLSANQMLMYRATSNYRACNQAGGHPVVMCDAVAAAVYLDDRLVRKASQCVIDVEVSGASRGATLIDWPYRRHEADSASSSSSAVSPSSPHSRPEPPVRVVEELDHALYTSMLEHALSK
mmetsp:Transcript_9930/g.30558  ORF Transcript_9930/g.30558 Transcript_9930/m.30558 type:complete len:350 (-) Transcript_9930:52-1101(-)